MPSQPELSKETSVLLAKEMTFEQIMHKKTAEGKVGFTAMLGKDKEAQKAASADYFRHWDNKAAKDETKETRDARKEEYASITRQYYNLATDFYEYGWGSSFHFCRFAYGEPFRQAIARHEHYLAHSIGIKKGMKVLDVGCGVGGPAREIAKFTGAYITGITINEYQVQRATHYAAKEGLSDFLQFVQGDFMVPFFSLSLSLSPYHFNKSEYVTAFSDPCAKQELPFEDDTFDAIYAIEATVHAPSLAGVYSEIRRVLKPGGVFGVYEWVMTDAYDNDNLHHREIRLAIEQGDGIANMVKAEVALAAVAEAGLELLEHEDLSARPEDSIPWYWPLDGSGWRHASNISDMLMTLRMTRVASTFFHNFMRVLEGVGLAPPGTKRTGDSLQEAAGALVQGAKERLFTPMFLMVARKPEVKESS